MAITWNGSYGCGYGLGKTKDRQSDRHTNRVKDRDAMQQKLYIFVLIIRGGIFPTGL